MPGTKSNAPAVTSDEGTEFAKGRALARASGTPDGVDPKTGERRAANLKALEKQYGKEEGRRMFRDIAVGGGFGDPEREPYLYSQDLDLSSIKEAESRVGSQIDSIEDDERRERAQEFVEDLKLRRERVEEVLAKEGRR